MLLILFLMSFIFWVIPANAMLGVYENISNNEINNLSHFYQNNNNTELIPVYNQSCEIQKNYPFFSYTLALKCHRQVIKKDILNQIQYEGEEKAITNLNEFLQKETKNLESQIYSLNNSKQTISSNEWLSLSSYELSNSVQKLQDAQEYPEKKDINKTIGNLTESSYHLYKAQTYLKVAQDESNSQPKVDAKEFKIFEKGIAQKWIEDAENKIKELNTARVNEYNGNLPQNYLNTSKEYYSKENYYLSTMYSAGSIALVKMELDDNIKTTNNSFIITKANEELQISRKQFENVSSAKKIDAPITELHLEMAGLYLEESSKSDSTDVYPLAIESIRNSVIAREQTKVISELSTSTSEQTDPLTTPVVTTKVSSGTIDSVDELLKTMSNRVSQYFY